MNLNLYLWYQETPVFDVMHLVVIYINKWCYNTAKQNYLLVHICYTIPSNMAPMTWKQTHKKSLTDK
jgi:hypothetical protein